MAISAASSAGRTIAVSSLVLFLALALSACALASRERVLMDAPYFASLDRVASGSELVVEGTVREHRGAFPLPGDNSHFAYEVYTFEVRSVLGSHPATSIAPGSVLSVGMFAVSAAAEDKIVNVDEVRSEIAGYAGPLNIGAPLTLFLASFTFAPDMQGWAVVGGRYGILEPSGDSWTSQAPLGPLREKLLARSDIDAALQSLGNGSFP